MISAEGRLRAINLPNRRATSRHRSFSIRPVEPIVPVSWPPWPGSMTMRPILSPNTRVKECSPLRVGFAAGSGPMLSAILLSDSVVGTAAAATLGEVGIGRRDVEALTDRGNNPSAGLGGLSRRVVLVD